MTAPAGRRLLLVAHRAANDPTDRARVDDAAAAGADLLEADVHLFAGRLEVRHSKALWPTSRLFEGRRLLPRDAPRPQLEAVLPDLPLRPGLWLDLKGPDPRLGRRVEQVAQRRPLWVSARSWWQLAAFRDRDGVSTFMSVGSRWQRSLALRLLDARWADGIVIHEQLVTRSFMTAVSSAPVVVWAVTSRRRAETLVEFGVSGLILDDLDVMRSMRRHSDEDA